MSLTEVHARLATSMLLFLAVAGLWGIGSSLLKRGMTPAFWGILAIGELLIVAQTIVGAALWLEGARPARGIHVLYGAVSLLSLPGYFAYSRGQENPRSALNYGLLCLFLVGISLRAMGTAS